MQDNYEKLRSKFSQIKSINVPCRPYQITMNFDCSTILVFTINCMLHHFQRYQNVWNLVLSQNLYDQFLSVQVNSRGTILALISRKFGYFWIEYLIYNKRKWILKNKFKLKQDPDPYVSMHNYSISQDLQFCTYEFQWNRKYQRINAFSITSFFKRIQRQKIKGAQIIFSNNSNFFVVVSLDKLELKVYNYFQFNYILYQPQCLINSYIDHFILQLSKNILECIIESNSTILIHSTELVLWNFKTNKKTKIMTPNDMFLQNQSCWMRLIGNLILIQFNNEIVVFEQLLQKLKYFIVKIELKYINFNKLLIQLTLIENRIFNSPVIDKQ